MLTIAKLGTGQENYYLSKVAQGVEDYYTGEGESPGQWRGRGAARLGLDGEVASEDLAAALAGEEPGSGERLAGRVSSRRVPGWDLTFSAPKSVSVLYGLGGSEVAAEVAAAHAEAVHDALTYLESHATVSRRRIDGRIEQVRGEGLVVAAFQHRTSRAGDPQLHTHALVANLVEHLDGGWGSLHSPVIYQHARTAGFIYQAVLRGELTARLGVEWDEPRNGCAEISGVDPELVRVFSKRRAEIDLALADAGEDSARAAQVAAHRTRSAKEYGVDPGTLQERWEAEAVEVGVEPGTVRTSATGHSVELVDTDTEAVIEEMVGPSGLTAGSSTFDRRDVFRRWCEQIVPGSPVRIEDLERLADEALADERMVTVVDELSALSGDEVAVGADGSVTSALAVRQRWTTEEMLEVEARLIDRSIAGAASGAGVVPAPMVEDHLEGREDLTGEQAEMVRRLATSGDGVQVVVGRAGTGKTYALAAAADLWRASGHRVIGVALAARAAAELETGAAIPSGTVASHLRDIGLGGGGVDHQSVIVVDEAGMVDTRRLAQIVEHAAGVGAKVVLVGDHHQLPSVEAGGAFGALVHRMEPIELTENRRQRELWEQDTLARLRSGEDGPDGIRRVVDTYGAHGRLHIGSTPVEVRGTMVADWYQARSDGKSVAMVALRRGDVDELNCRARALLVEDGTVAAEGLEVGERTFAMGDRVVCLANDRRLGVHNAMFATVVAVDENGVTVETEADQQPVVIPVDYIAEGNLDHGYATTVHKAQGATYDQLFMLGDDRLYRQAGYTGLSRGRDRNDLYLVEADDRDLDPNVELHGPGDEERPAGERIVSALARDGAKRLATDQQQPGGDPGWRLSLAELWSRYDKVGAGQVAAGSPGELRTTIRARTIQAGRHAETTRPEHVVALIGEPPTDQAQRGGWRRAAGEIESYCARWGVAPDPELGSEFDRGQTQHLARVHGAVAKVIEARSRGFTVELPGE